MRRLIDANALIEQMHEEIDKYYLFIDAFEYLLENAPTVDAVEVVHGWWLLERTPDGKPYCFHCSVCDDDFSHIGITTAFNYCPNCGADMRERKEQ